MAGEMETEPRECLMVPVLVTQCHAQCGGKLVSTGQCYSDTYHTFNSVRCEQCGAVGNITVPPLEIIYRKAVVGEARDCSDDHYVQADGRCRICGGWRWQPPVRPRTPPDAPDVE